MPLLGYGNKWQNFVDVIKKAMISCETTGNIVTDHFTGTSKMVEIGSRAKRSVQDYYLSRLACYLIAMNGNSRKPEIAAAQNYFAVTTRAHEMHQLRQEREARIQIRLEVAEGNKQLSEQRRRWVCALKCLGSSTMRAIWGSIPSTRKTSASIRVFPKGARS